MLLISNSSSTDLQNCTSNHMFGRAIWDKLPQWIFENFKIARVKRGFSKITRVIYSKNRLNQTFGY